MPIKFITWYQKKIKIIPRKGEYYLLDKVTNGLVDHTIFQVPTEMSKGVLITPTVHGNILIGPNACDIEDKDDVSTSSLGLEEVKEKAFKSIENIPFNAVITTFSGLRAHEIDNDFVIGELEDSPLFFDCAGIASPGLTSAPAIAEDISKLIANRLNARQKENFISKRSGFLRPLDLSNEEINKLIKENSSYGNIICRCEKVTEEEIIDSITRPLGAKTIDGVKRRVRPGSGRCQGGFCILKVSELIRDYGKIDLDEVRKFRKGSEIIFNSDLDSTKQPSNKSSK